MGCFPIRGIKGMPTHNPLFWKKNIVLQVLFRYALAILTSIEDKLMQQNDYLAIFNTFRAEVETGLDTRRMTQVAFHNINPFPLRIIRSKREHHAKIYQVMLR